MTEYKRGSENHLQCNCGEGFSTDNPIKDLRRHIAAEHPRRTLSEEANAYARDYANRRKQ